MGEVNGETGLTWTVMSASPVYFTVACVRVGLILVQKPPVAKATMRDRPMAMSRRETRVNTAQLTMLEKCRLKRGSA
jgi:hypothetical protein